MATTYSTTRRRPGAEHMVSNYVAMRADVTRLDDANFTGYSIEVTPRVQDAAKLTLEKAGAVVTPLSTSASVVLVGQDVASNFTVNQHKLNTLAADMIASPHGEERPSEAIENEAITIGHVVMAVVAKS